MSSELLYLFPVVFAAGFMDAIAGGGGLLTIPAYLFAGIPPAFALGTNKFVMTSGITVSVARYILDRRVVWPVALVGIPCSLIGAAYGAHTVATLSQDYVRSAILIFLPLAALLTLFRPRTETAPPQLHWRSARLWILIPLLSVAIGWYDGFFGPGTGSLLMIALHGLAGLSLLQSAAVSRILNLTSNASALVAFVVYQKVIYALALPLAVASIAGYYCGSHYAIRNGERLIRPMLLLAIALLMIFVAWESWCKG